jgi:hypothetical protein
MHEEAHPLAGRVVKIREGVTDPGQGAVIGGVEYELEDWWDRLTGGSWMFANGNPAAMHYGIRQGTMDNPSPIDDEVVYGKIGSFGHLVHVTEIELPGADR